MWKQNSKSSHLHACQIYSFSALGSVAGEGQQKKSRKYDSESVVLLHLHVYTN